MPFYDFGCLLQYLFRSAFPLLITFTLIYYAKYRYKWMPLQMPSVGYEPEKRSEEFSIKK